MDYFSKRKILKEINQLDADYVILDLGAGSAYNTLDFFLVNYKSILVTTPEITSILNAYSFLKSSVFRFFAQQFPARGEERKLIQDYTHTRLEGSELSFTNLIEEIYNKYPETGAKAINKLDMFRPQVILNKGRTSSDIEMAQRLKSLVKNKLNMNMEFILIYSSFVNSFTSCSKTSSSFSSSKIDSLKVKLLLITRFAVG